MLVHPRQRQHDGGRAAGTCPEHSILNRLSAEYCGREFNSDHHHATCRGLMVEIAWTEYMLFAFGLCIVGPFVLSNLMLFIGIALASMPIVIIAAVVRGVGYAGGVLAWNLGHHDFAPPGESGRYMGTHVTLTGIRGLCAPLLGVFLWQWLGWPAFALPLILSLAGALGFLALARQWGQMAQRTVVQG